MSQQKLAPKEFKRDADFTKALHGSAANGGYNALLGKNRDAQAQAIDGYFKHWDNKGPKNETDQDKQAGLDDYSELTKLYYHLVTDFYEYGWGSSSFCQIIQGRSIYPIYCSA